MIRQTEQELRDMRELCREYGSYLFLLRPGEPSGDAVLYSLFLVERYNKDNSKPRSERSYRPGGIYFPKVKPLWEKYQDAAACSYSNFQIMFPTASELGFEGTPQELDHDKVAIVWVVELLKRRVIWMARKTRGFAPVESIYDGYNSGNPNDKRIPEAYIRKGLVCYQLAQRALNAVRPAPEAVVAGQPVVSLPKKYRKK